MTINKHNSPAPLLLLLVPGTAHAHGSLEFTLAPLTIFCLAGGIGVLIKQKLFIRYFQGIEAPSLQALIGVSLLEVCIMIASQYAAIATGQFAHILAVFFLGCLIFLLPAAVVNTYLVRQGSHSIVKGLLLAGLFPLLCTLLIPIIFIPFFMVY
jgi:hypothetical protein